MRERKVGPRELTASTRRRVLEGEVGTRLLARLGVTGENHMV